MLHAWAKVIKKMVTHPDAKQALVSAQRVVYNIHASHVPLDTFRKLRKAYKVIAGWRQGRAPTLGEAGRAERPHWRQAGRSAHAVTRGLLVHACCLAQRVTPSHDLACRHMHACACCHMHACACLPMQTEGGGLQSAGTTRLNSLSAMVSSVVRNEDPFRDCPATLASACAVTWQSSWQTTAAGACGVP